MKTRLLTVSALLAVASCAIAAPTDQPASLKITNTHLVATCFGGTAVESSQRSWNVIAPVSLTFTMKNEPRPGIENVPAGVAMITFTPEAGHKYEVEVQTVATANSLRVWPRGEWTPTVRDRTTNKIVSGEPKWIESGCGS